jgi:hypothetical protein
VHLSRLTRADEQRLVDKVAARIPTWKAGTLNAVGRTTLTQTADHVVGHPGAYLDHLLPFSLGDY